MPRALGLLLRYRPSQLLLGFWAVLFLAAAASEWIPLEGVATSVILAMWFGYSYLVVLGLPVGTIRNSVRATGRLLSWVFMAVVIATMVPAFQESGLSSINIAECWDSARWPRILVGLGINATLFVPPILATMALNDARRRARLEPNFASIPTWLAFLALPFGGVLYVHSQLRQALNVG